MGPGVKPKEGGFGEVGKPKSDSNNKGPENDSGG